jgi:hypothetical protein
VRVVPVGSLPPHIKKHNRILYINKPVGKGGTGLSLNLEVKKKKKK